MFVAVSDYEIPLMTALGGPGEKFFRAMELSVRLPWFLVTALIQDGRDELLHTVCCSWESDLVDLLSVRSKHSVVALQRLTPSSLRDGRWELRDVTHVWQARHPTGQSLMIYQDADGEEFCGEFGEAVRAGLTDRSLLFEAEAPHAASSLQSRGWRRSPREQAPQVIVPIYAGALDPFAVVSAGELGAMLAGIDVEEVRRQEAAGRLLSVAGGYPVYQALPEIAGEPFARLLAVLLAGEPPTPHDFFVYESPELGLLTPVEAMLGAATNDRALEVEAAMVLTADAAVRHEYLMGAARAFVADTSGW